MSRRRSGTAGSAANKQGGEADQRRHQRKEEQRYKAADVSFGEPQASFQNTMYQAQSQEKLDSLEDKLSHITDEQRVRIECADEGGVERGGREDACRKGPRQG